MSFLQERSERWRAVLWNMCMTRIETLSFALKTLNKFQFAADSMREKVRKPGSCRADCNRVREVNSTTPARGSPEKSTNAVKVGVPLQNHTSGTYPPLSCLHGPKNGTNRLVFGCGLEGARSDADAACIGPACLQNSLPSSAQPTRKSNSCWRPNAILARRTATSRWIPMSGNEGLMVSDIPRR